MTLLGLPVPAFLLGLGGLGAALLALHLLRIRLRRQTVDSLLFFRQVGAVHKPRVLFGRPARWLSFALGLALLAAAWTAFARPRGTDDGPSRVVVVDTTAATSGRADDSAEPVHDQLAARAAEIASRDGLGPRGRVIAFGESVRTVWQEGEPTDRIVERLAATPAAGSTHSIWTALTDAACDLGEGDEIVVIGGPEYLPATVDGVALRRDAAPPASARAAIVAVRITDTSPRALEVDAATGGGVGTLRVRSGDALLAETRIAAAPGATTRARLAPIPDPAAKLVVEVESASGARASVEVAIPARQPLRIHVAPGLPEAVALAVAADPRAVATRVDDADVAIAPSGAPLPARLSALIVEPGAGDAPRTPRILPACPVPLSLRDRTRTATALAARGGEVWVEDAATGAALVVRDGNRVRAVAWLLDDPAHRDVPALVLGAIRALAPAPPARIGPTAAPAPGGAATAPALDARTDSWPFVALLLGAALLALAVDAWLHHRGRVA